MKKVNPYEISLSVEYFNATLRNKALSLQQDFDIWRQLDKKKALDISDKIYMICDLKETLAKLN